MIYQHRLVIARGGRLVKRHAAFQKEALGALEEHGSVLIGAWEVWIGPEAGCSVYQIRQFESLAAWEQHREAFRKFADAQGVKLVECELSVNGRGAIPAEMKSLTASGKLSVKAMPKGRFHEVYQDYVCGCVLRAAREVLALLPVDAVIVTAAVSEVHTVTGGEVQIPVLSVSMPRAAVEQLDFARLDPSDSMENFTHRGDVMASRKSAEFVAVVPLQPTDIVGDAPTKRSLSDVLARVHEMRAEISVKFKKQKSETSPLRETTPD